MSKNPINADLTTTRKEKSLVSLTKVLKFSSKQVRSKWCKQLLYKLYIIHNEFANAKCNVCLDNLKVDEDNNLVLTNVFQNSTTDTKLATDIKFKAPELLDCNNESKTGDVWAAGICIYYVINLSFPWQVADEKDAKFYKWKFEGMFSSAVDSSFERVLTQMLCVEPNTRASIKEVLKTLNSETNETVLGNFQ